MPIVNPDWFKKWPKLYFLLYWVKYSLEIRKAEKLIIIYTPGHVGSSTVLKSLLTGEWDKLTKIYDIHSFNERYNNDSEIDSVSARHVLQEVLRKYIITGKLESKLLFLITLFRDPISRALGGKFQNSGVFIKEIDLEGLSKNNYSKALDILRSNMIESKFLTNTIDWQLAFFQKELKEFWSFDLYNDISKIEEGFFFGKRDNIKILVFVLEVLDKNLVKQIKRYLGKDIIMINANMNSNAKFYNYCKQNLRFSSGFIENLYNQPIMKYFYSVEKIQELKNHWSSLSTK